MEKQKIFKIKPEVVKENKNRPLEWRVEETPSAPRSPELALALGIIALGLLLFAILTQDYLFALIVILAVFILYIQRKREAQLISFSATADGISVNRRIYPYSDYESFWIFGEEHEHGKELALHSKKRLATLFLVPLAPGLDITKLKTILLEHLEEKEEKESLVDLLRKAYF